MKTKMTIEKLGSLLKITTEGVEGNVCYELKDWTVFSAIAHYLEHEMKEEPDQDLEDRVSQLEESMLEMERIIDKLTEHAMRLTKSLAQIKDEIDSKDTIKKSSWFWHD